MSELQDTHAIRRHLDLAAQRLPYRVTERLQRARLEALARMPASGEVATLLSGGLSDAQSAPTRAGPTLGDMDERRRRALPPLWLRVSMAAAPLVLMLGGLLAIVQWHDERRIEELAELDAAVLIDDVPIAAYADKGFGVFLKNAR